SRRGITEAADLHGDLLDVRSAAGGSEVTVAVDLGPAYVHLDGAAEAGVAEIRAEDRKIRALVVLAPGVGPRGYVGVEHERRAVDGDQRRGDGDREGGEGGALRAVADGYGDVRVRSRVGIGGCAGERSGGAAESRP